MGYHGFGKRERTSVNEYLDRIRRLFSEKKNPQKHFNKGLPEKKNNLFNSLGISDTMRELFYLYSEFAASKAYRRLAELKNFYFLDKLIEIIAVRNNIPEGYLRFMTPEEIINIIENGFNPEKEPEYKNRMCSMIYYYCNGNEKIINCSDRQHDNIQNIIKKNDQPADLNTIRGRTACPGFASGIATIRQYCARSDQ